MSVLLPVIAFVIAAWLCWQFSRPGSRFYILDHPNERSLHSQPTPRTGGLGILVGLYLAASGMVAWIGAVPIAVFWIAGTGLMVAIVSFLDDRFSVPVLYRMIVHFIAAGGLVYGGLGLEAFQLPGVTWNLDYTVAFILTLLIVVWLVNLYNFMDGMDGFAGGMALFGFGAYAVLGWMAGDQAFASLSLIIAAAAVGFLVFNFPPARIFMGDTGSSLLGFLAAAFAFWADRDGIFPLWVGVLIFSPFIVDATVTLFRRAYRKERIWQAHKSHYYQRLVQLGWGHRKTVLWEYALMALCGVSAIWALSLSPAMQWGIIGFWVFFYGVLMIWVGRLEKRIKRKS